MSDLVGWLKHQVAERGWSNNELPRRAGLSPASISQVLSGQRNPGLQFCFGAAKGLDEPPETMLRLAGFLPIKPAPDEELEEIAYYSAG